MSTPDPSSLDFTDLVEERAPPPAVRETQHDRAGLTHLAVALGRPSIGLYCATDPAATGLYGSPVAVSLGGVGHAPSVEEVFAEVERLRSVA